MADRYVFISHSTARDPFVRRLREALEKHRWRVWADSRDLTGGQLLEPELRAAIAGAAHQLVVIGPATVNSRWVRDEVTQGRAAQAARSDGFKVIPLLLDGIEEGALALWFGDQAQPLAIKVRGETGGAGPGAGLGLEEALPAILAALGSRLSTDPEAADAVVAAPIADLVLELEEPAMEQGDGKRRAAARARLVYTPAREAGGGDPVRGRSFRFVAPMGPIEAEEIAWYLERYSRWPSEVFVARARKVEEALPRWGRSILAALEASAGRDQAAANALAAWREADRAPVAGGRAVVRRFSVYLDARAAEGASGASAETAAAGGVGSDGASGGGEGAAAGNADGSDAEAATVLLSLPWELLADKDGFLFQGARPARVRRRLPRGQAHPTTAIEPPLRILLASPRPEDERAAYIDHRVSARALVDALAPLGDRVELTLLAPPTLPALEQALGRAHAAGRPFHVVHFDGHGVYDRRHGLGALCFEDPADADKPFDRRTAVAYAGDLASVLREQRVPLVFLEACQTAMAEADPTASVAGELLEGGVASVVAMSYSVLVETARRFVSAFYETVVEGGRVGEAMLAGQRALHGDSWRGRGFLGDLRLADWFVPVLYQEEDDAQLVRRRPSTAARTLKEAERKAVLGDLPPAPEHGFVGRSRELLAAERLLVKARHVVLTGEGGEGKTALATELARWLVATRRSARAAFVSLESHGTSARAALDALGRQLVPGYAAAGHGADIAAARLPVERALDDAPAVIVVDNVESVLPPAPGAPGAAAFDEDVLADLIGLFEALGAAGDTRLVFTSREALPAPFAGNRIPIDCLSRSEAIELVGRVMREQSLRPSAADAGQNDAEVEALVDAVAGHARSLVLLGREVAESGVRVTTDNLRRLMARLEARHPGERERSLFASVALSLERLPAETRTRIRPLGVFHGGGQVAAMAMVLGIEDLAEIDALVEQLVAVGLATRLSYGYVRFDPGLGPSLLGELNEAERQAAVDGWAKAMAGLTQFLFEQLFKEGAPAATLVALNLSNLLGALESKAAASPAEETAAIAGRLERLVQPLGRPATLKAVVAVRETAALRLGERSPDRFNADLAAIERLLETGRSADAATAARALLDRAEEAGEGAYAAAPYDLAVAHILLGRALKGAGEAARAISYLDEARRRFLKLAAAGDQDAARMAVVALSESADCLTDLGRLHEAASAYEEAIRDDLARGGIRDAAVGQSQLGTVRMLQRRFKDALEAFGEARKTFAALGEPASVAVEWRLIGAVHRQADQYDAAEIAYQESLKIETQLEDRSGEAGTLDELGKLYSAMNRLEDAARFHRLAGDTFHELGDLRAEGTARSNAAGDLLSLGRHDEARTEILRAIECERPFSHAAEPWKTYAILHDLEAAVGNRAAAAAARDRAIDAYLAYRRDGGESTTPGESLCAQVRAALATGEVPAASAELDALLAESDLPGEARSLISALEQVLAGRRDSAVADDPALFYADAAELRLVLESLAAASG